MATLHYWKERGERGGRGEEIASVNFKFGYSNSTLEYQVHDITLGDNY